MSEVSYANAGVDLETSAKAKERIKRLASTSHTNEVLKGIGLFSGFFVLNTAKYREPVLTASIDGVGTKVKVAQMMSVYDTIGQDLVNHCVNDIMVSAADPLFFMDYIAADKLEAEAVAEIVRGISEACKASGCALIGGETAEMPGVYLPNHFDLAGSIVGVVDRSAILDGGAAEVGDVLIGLPSNGLHTNGYSLVRKVFFDLHNYGVEKNFPELDRSLGEELLRTHRSYASVIRAVRDVKGLRGIAHITGGGIVGNTRRLLASGLAVKVDWSAWPWPPIFKLLQVEGDVSDKEMRNVFNLGIGLTLIAAQQEVERVLEGCCSAGEQATVIGEIVHEAE